MIGCGDEPGLPRGGCHTLRLVGDLPERQPVCAASPEPAFDPTRLVETHCHADLICGSSKILALSLAGIFAGSAISSPG